MAINKVTSVVALLALSFFLACSKSKNKVSPEAIILNDSAVNIAQNSFGNDSISLRKAIYLLNRAIKIDSNYFIAYCNKFNFQNQAMMYDSALVTGKLVLKFRPNFTIIQMQEGSIYEKLGDTVLAYRYYKSALSTTNKILDTMRSENHAYSQVLEDKAVFLILLKKEKEGRDILKKLYEKKPEGFEKDMFKDYISMTRDDFLYPTPIIKDLTKPH